MNRKFRYSTKKHPYYEVRCNPVDLETGQQIKGWFIYDKPTEWEMNGAHFFLCFCCFPCFLCCNDELGYQVPDFQNYEPPPVIPSAPQLPVAMLVQDKPSLDSN